MQQVSEQEMAVYRETARRLAESRKVHLAPRRGKAWSLARRAADVLRRDFGAVRVVVFGSLLSDAGFTEWSDVDIAVWGIPSKDVLRAIETVLHLDGEMPVNLVAAEECRDRVRHEIERDGRDV